MAKYNTFLRGNSMKKIQNWKTQYYTLSTSPLKKKKNTYTQMNILNMSIHIIPMLTQEMQR